MNDQSKRLAEALADILDAIEENEKRPRKRQMKPRQDPTAVPGLYSLAELGEMEDAGEFVIVDPVGQALRLGVRDIGGIIVRHVDDLDGMREVAEFAASSSGRYGHRINIVSKHWHGLKAPSWQMAWMA